MKRDARLSRRDLRGGGNAARAIDDDDARLRHEPHLQTPPALLRQPLAPRELLGRVASRYAQQAEQKRIALRIEPDGALPEIQVDEARMIQVLSNLVANALRHTPPQGAVRLSAQRAGDRVRFAVTDTGAGIRAEDLARVFERFYRGDASRSGSSGEADWV